VASGLSPALSPLVSDDPAPFGASVTVGGPSDDQYGVVPSSVVVGIIDDSSMVATEKICVKADQNGALVHHAHELVLVVTVYSSGVSPLSLCRVAVTVVLSVGVLGLGGDTVVLDPIDSLCTTTTSGVALAGEHTVLELLVGKAGNLSRGEGDTSFSCTGGGKSPAGSTSSLVLDMTEDSALTPIDRVSESLCLGEGDGGGDAVALIAAIVFISKMREELGESFVGELVDVLLPSDESLLVLQVVGGDLGEVLQVDGLALDELGGGIVLVVLLAELFELLGDGSCVVSTDIKTFEVVSRGLGRSESQSGCH